MRLSSDRAGGLWWDAKEEIGEVKEDSPFVWDSKQDKFRAETRVVVTGSLVAFSENGCVGSVRAEAYFQGLRKKTGRGNGFQES